MVYYKGKRRGPYHMDEELVGLIRQLIEKYPRYGIRRIHHVLKYECGKAINIKTVHRIMKRKQWTLKDRSKGFRPRVWGWRSRCERPDERWAIDTTHFFTEANGWCHMTGVIDCCDRMIVGHRVSASGKTAVAEGALEDALITRRPSAGLKLRSDNGLVFGAKGLVALCRKWGVKPEYITPYTPEQNGLIERFFRSLKEECIWLYNFVSVHHAQRVIGEWIETYNNNRPHYALGKLSPMQWRQKYVA